jgi:glycine cleavage system regulatory protein
MVNAAIAQYGIDASWAAPKTNNSDAIIEHINDMCNEFHLNVTPQGTLIKATAAAQSAAKDLPDWLKGKSPQAIKKLMLQAVKDLKLPPSWGPSATNDLDTLIDEMDDMCNEFHLTMGVDGRMVYNSF